MLATRSKGSNTATEGGKHDASGRITTRDFGIFLMPTRQSGNAGPVTNVHPSCSRGQALVSVTSFV